MLNPVMTEVKGTCDWLAPGFGMRFEVWNQIDGMAARHMGGCV
jgi:hypothetical protein